MERDDRRIRPGEPGEKMVTTPMAAGAAIAVVIVAAAFYFWPAEESGLNTSTDPSTQVQTAPTKPAGEPSTPTSPNQ